MSPLESTKAIIALATATLGIAVALWTGAPLAAALVALSAGAMAAVLVRSPASAAPPLMPPATMETHLPGVAGVMDAIVEPILVVRDRRVIMANDGARTLLGTHIEGSDVRLAIRHPAAAEHLAGEPTTASPVRVELVGLGDLARPWEMMISPLPDGSRLVRLADQSQLRAAEQMRVDFVANASHELRTPLATLLGFLETLQDQSVAADASTRDRFIKIMFGEATRMRDLLDDLMSLSRIEADRFTLPRETVDLVTLIAEVTDAAKPLAAGRNVTLETEIDAALVAGDRGQLRQMLSNLVANSLKYGLPNTPVCIRLDHSDTDLIRVTVIDEGEGISSEHIPRLTERFYCVDPGRSRQVGGTGLGLAIVKHIVLRHRGRLNIASTPGEGTRVQIVLPRATSPS